MWSLLVVLDSRKRRILFDEVEHLEMMMMASTII